MPRGGSRPRAGRPKGSRGKHKRTLEKLTALEVFRRRAEAELDPLITARLENAKGLFQFLAMTPLGPVLVTDPAIMQKCIASGEPFYRIVRKEPDERALKDTFDRVCGKPTEHVDVTGHVDHAVHIVHKHLIETDAKALTP